MKMTNNNDMDRNEFWKLIDMFEWKHLGNDGEVLKKAIKYLLKKSDEEIKAFDDVLSNFLYDLDDKVYAENIGEGTYVNGGKGFSVDEFLYSRCVVVANGKKFTMRF